METLNLCQGTWLCLNIVYENLAFSTFQDSQHGTPSTVVGEYSFQSVKYTMK